MAGKGEWKAQGCADASLQTVSRIGVHCLPCLWRLVCGVEPPAPGGDHVKERMRRFLVREDAEYDAFVDQYQARTPIAKSFYLFMHLLPGLLAYMLINVQPVHAAALQLTGWPDTLYQGSCILGVFAWHVIVPFLVLRYVDGLSARESLAFLSLNKLDAKGFFLVMPLAFVVYTALSLPYMNYAFPALTDYGHFRVQTAFCRVS